MDNNTQLNIKNYFSHFIFHPLSNKLSPRDQKIAAAATLLFSVIPRPYLIDLPPSVIN